MYLGRSPLSGAFLKLDTIQPQFNSVLNTFPLTVSAESVSPGSAQNLIIVLNGVVQEPQASYNIDGSNIVFSFAVATGTPFFGVMLGHIGSGATNYTHPANHPPSIITQDASNRFVTDAEKTSWNAKQAAGSYEVTTNKDLSNGYAGLTLYKINFRNAANTFTNYLTNATTASRTYTFKDADGTVAFTSDITGNNSGTNTGDNSPNSLYSGLVSNATHTGDATGSTALTVVGLNGVNLAGLSTGLLKNTTGTGVPSIAVAGTDYVTPSGSEMLTSKTLTNPTVTNYVETVYTPAAGSAWTVDLANGTVHKLTTNANATVTLPSSVAGKSYVILIAYGGTHSITWAGGSTIKWAGGSAPAATAVNGKFDIFAFFCDGTNTYGRSGGSNF